MRYLLINLEVQDGERRHQHRCLHQTNAKNLDFAVQRYVSTFWGYGTHDSGWWNYGECMGRVVNYHEITKDEYKRLAELFHGL